ncbi:MAG: 4-hydroxythreonine-4-phosphate dehydrogenase PdxA [Planctomycetes bacterium]|nr:4-hydroxythreonine-4-phosphate dehydrogenase PdxA [Planctomycetota bacterium]
MSMHHELVIACGDPQGIGPEVAAAAAQRFVQEEPLCALVLVGVQSQLSALLPSVACMSVDSAAAPGIRVLSVQGEVFDKAPPSSLGGLVALRCLEAALLRVRACGSALVTAPLSKQAVALNAPGFRGHTEWLGQRCGSEPLMLFSAPGLKLALATVHVSLARVPAEISGGAVDRALRLLHSGLLESYQIKAPSIAVLALNPHAGEGGLLGSEERKHIAPALERARAAGINAKGPFSADGFFGAGEWRRFDAVLAMYHDQGLVAVKSLGFGNAVNVTLGLPIVRTSVDHGCAFALAGKGMAKSDSMLAALREALLLQRLRNPV